MCVAVPVRDLRNHRVRITKRNRVIAGSFFGNYFRRCHKFRRRTFRTSSRAPRPPPTRNRTDGPLDIRGAGHRIFWDANGHRRPVPRNLFLGRAATRVSLSLFLFFRRATSPHIHIIVVRYINLDLSQCQTG